MLCLACPAGSDEDDEWLSTRAEIEGDDRVCRKLLWLPPNSIETTESSLEWMHRQPAGTKKYDEAPTRLQKPRRALRALNNR